MAKILLATIRDCEDELHIECRFDDNQKFAAITIDKTIDNADALAHKILELIQGEE